MVSTAFTVLIIAQCLVIVLHDLVHIEGWTHGRQVRAAIGERKFWVGTVVNAVFPAIAAGLAFKFWQATPTAFATRYWVTYCAITVLSAVAMWWIPYFFGTKTETEKLYAAMYKGTRQVLPARGDNPRPNLLHLFFHVLFVVNLLLAVLLWLRRS